jgi:pyruvate formate lyase activating enzyme
VNETTGTIFEIQRFSIHDGPGIRTTVFLKGCPLRCVWCHNPEGIERAPRLSFLADRCIGCGYCFGVCPQHGHQMVDGVHVLQRQACLACGRCSAKCYAGALELVGRQVGVQEVIEEVLKDRPFYETSGGGMTLSGGEPMLQLPFTLALLRAAKGAGLHTAMETCGYTTSAALDRVRPFVDLFLFDLKETDPARHLEYTGVENAPILAALRHLHDAGATVLLRLPIVPGLNDRPEHLRCVAERVRELPRLQGVEIMPYHRLGSSKRQRFGLSADPLAAVETPTADAVAGWVRSLRELGVHVINEIRDETEAAS